MKKEVKKQILSVILGIGMVFSIKLIVFISRKQNNHNFIFSINVIFFALNLYVNFSTI